jgi:hypothetical protein
MHFALRELKIDTGKTGEDGKRIIEIRQPGDAVPEAARWGNPGVWINRGDITDAEGFVWRNRKKTGERMTIETAPPPGPPPEPPGGEPLHAGLGEEPETEMAAGLTKIATDHMAGEGPIDWGPDVGGEQLPPPPEVRLGDEDGADFVALAAKVETELDDVLPQPPADETATDPGADGPASSGTVSADAATEATALVTPTEHDDWPGDETDPAAALVTPTEAPKPKKLSRKKLAAMTKAELEEHGKLWGVSFKGYNRKNAMVKEILAAQE